MDATLKPADSPHLTPEQFAELQQWQRRMVATFTVCVLGLFSILALDVIFNPGGAIGWVFLAVLVSLAVMGARVQFSQKCPGCGARLGYQTRLLLPARCRRCGVELKPRTEP